MPLTDAEKKELAALRQEYAASTIDGGPKPASEPAATPTPEPGLMDRWGLRPKGGWLAAAGNELLHGVNGRPGMKGREVISNFGPTGALPLAAMPVNAGGLVGRGMGMTDMSAEGVAGAAESLRPVSVASFSNEPSALAAAAGNREILADAIRGGASTVGSGLMGAAKKAGDVTGSAIKWSTIGGLLRRLIH